MKLKVNKSAGPFDALFCVGQFFPGSPELLEEFMDYVEGRTQIPLPTYFIGDYGVGAPKVLIVASKNSSNLGFKMDGLKIFITNEWPTGVTNRATSDIPAGISDSAGSDSTISELVAEIKPRYHIAGAKGLFYAREPYSNIDAVHVTRFFGSTMTAVEISMKPSNTTSSPYTFSEQTVHPKETTKRPSDSVSDSQYWRYDVSQKRQKAGARDGKCERGPDCNFKHDLQSKVESYSHRRHGSENANRSKECWFCLSSPSVESHLIISIGESYYCALAKGPLVQDHVLLIPIEHSPSTLSLPQECESELVRFKNNLKLYFKNGGKEAIIFEWVSKRGTHANLQAAPVPSSRVAAVQDIFNMAADKLGFKFVAMKFDNSSDSRKWLRAQFDRNYSFFYVELPDGTILSHLIEENERFPVQFGREVLAGLLNTPERADWRTCKLSKERKQKW
ncbi:hypothetical protein GH714_038787 [Hevea brasiliensis]|uniref:C3H1-type domain-containing protein n=1 Tax=Hevea brasiliensis TaxID=3981 RepID=A0A6A6K8N3_HEVBR|nr:hypothetical protein GH714_038787 [Hevea brasiliensis]